jgi:Family of unknown function (DUF6174)
MTGVSVRFRLMVCGLMVLAAASACTSSPDAPAPSTSVSTAGSPPPWTEPADYGFVLDRKCDSGPSLGLYRVAVQDHAVAGVSRIDGKTASGEEEIEVPTLAGLLELAQTAIDDGADATTVFDTADGHPIQVSINRDEEATGGADCFIVTEYTPAS